VSTAGSVPAVRPYASVRDDDWAEALLGGALAGRIQARRGELVDVLTGDGLVAEVDGHRAGVLTFRGDGLGAVEIAALAVVEASRGVGSALVRAAVVLARERQLSRIWVVTTNDNLDALRLYQRHGFRLVELRAGAVEQSRRTLKPSIPEVASNGIPIRDELELALGL
jgi:ribosomal protein S18 acetylase RimI-like enzyme